MKKRISGKSRAGLFVLAALAMSAIAPAAASAGVFDDTLNRGPVDVTGSHFNEGYNDSAGFNCSGQVRFQGTRPSYDLEYDFSCDSYFIGYVISSNKRLDVYDTESIVTDSEGNPSDNSEGFDCEGLIPGFGFSCRGNGSLDLDPVTSGQQMPSLYSISAKTTGTGTDSDGNTGVDCSATSVRLCLNTASSYTYEKTGALPSSIVTGKMGTRWNPCSKSASKRGSQRYFLTVYGYRYVEKIVSLDTDPAPNPISTGGYKLTASQPIRLKAPVGRCITR